MKILLCFLLLIGTAYAQTDPGPRGGPPGAGAPIAGLNASQLQFFNSGQAVFAKVDGVPPPGGLGPVFNGNSCSMCHAAPAVGGTSPAVNPQVALATLMDAANQVPFFVLPNGPVREVRFKYGYTRSGALDTTSADGGVHDLFSIAGRTDAPPSCTSAVLPQPNFSAASAEGNVIFRIPTPTFGGGLIENITDSTILASHRASYPQRTELGILGVANHSGNDGTITRFGWKAQNKSLLIFAGEAYNVEIGVTNEAFPNERSYDGAPPPPACAPNPMPEDSTNFMLNTGLAVPSDIENFSIFMRFLDQPKPACTGENCPAQVQAGRRAFHSVGCSACHTPAMATNASGFAPAALSGVQANLFSDLMIHHMGANLSDGISQGAAAPDQFRTAPLWGVGQRLFFLHDGRASDLLSAIRAHASQGSEANQVIANFNGLAPHEQQNVLDFLRSL